MALRLYDSLSRSTREFRPLRPPFVGVYVCGPTVYGHSHLGHAKSYISFDILVRYLRFSGYTVRYVQNITDVGHLLGDAQEGEDRMLRQGRLEQKHPMEIAEAYTRSYFEDMDALGVIRPDISPRATGHIPEQIGLIAGLMSKGLAYEANGSVYFAVSAFPAYGRLSGRTVDDLEAGARVEVKAEKRHPADFALWKRAEPEHILQWPSPWGAGYPGWHVECSAMAMKYLGESIDIHGGGLENQFPHHECEIAQSEGVTGRPFVNFWLHNNMVTVDGRKMGKSLGNFLTLKDAFATWPPAVVRFFILQSHYRSTLDFSNDALNGAARGLGRFAHAVQTLRSAPPGSGSLSVESFRARFRDAMDDDLNTPQAIAVLFDLVREANQALAGNGLSGESLRAVSTFLTEHAEGILGLATGAAAPAGTAGEAELIGLMIALRNDARARKDWTAADGIRDGLAALGVILEDKKDATVWKYTGRG
jgi:cysteinyl-tRNA synthetase